MMHCLAQKAKTLQVRPARQRPQTYLFLRLASSNFKLRDKTSFFYDTLQYAFIIITHWLEQLQEGWPPLAAAYIIASCCTSLTENGRYHWLEQLQEGWTPLAAACHRQKMGVIQQLILSGSSVDAIPSGIIQANAGEKLARGATTCCLSAATSQMTPGSWEKRLAKKVKKEVELQHSKDGDGQ
eukprot:1148053-Pelagomonas_calceolata.AAC.2